VSTLRRWRKEKIINETFVAAKRCKEEQFRIDSANKYKM
jgi:hypothetical protein